MAVTIHVGSVFFGFFLGYAVMGGVFLAMSFSERWHTGFSEGWKARKEYEERSTAERREE